MYKGEYMDFTFDYNMFRLMFNMVFFITIGMFVFIIIKNIKTWNQNNHSPRLVVEAEVVYPDLLSITLRFRWKAVIVWNLK